MTSNRFNLFFWIGIYAFLLNALPAFMMFGHLSSSSVGLALTIGLILSLIGFTSFVVGFTQRGEDKRTSKISGFTFLESRPFFILSVIIFIASIFLSLAFIGSLVFLSTIW